MESSPCSIVVVPFKATADPKTVESVYVFYDSEKPQPYILLEHQMDPKEPSTIYSATRLLLNKVVDGTKYPRLIFDETYQDYDWREETYQSLLGKMVNAPIAEFEGKTVFFVELTETMFIQEGKLKEIPLKEFQAIYSSLAQELTEAVDPAVTEKWPRFAVFACEPADRWEHHYEALYKGLYQGPREIWRSYRIHKFEFPTESDLKRLKGAVISGSNLGTYEPIEWILKFEEIIRSIINDHPIKLFGSCFGHQIIAQAMGGKCSRMKLEGKHCCLGREAITFKESANSFTNDFFKKLAGDGPFYGVEIHGDHVEEAPSRARVIGTSKSTAVEMFEIGDSVFCTQFHPEFNAHYMEKKVYKDEANCQKARIPNIVEILEGHVKQMNETRCDNAAINAFIKTFLKS